MIAGILLAAGRATRFGSSKMQAMLPDGRTVLEASLANLCTGLQSAEREANIVLVTRRDAAELALVRELALRHGVEFVINENAVEGMATSIASGVAVTTNADGWLIALGDMPYVLPHTIAAIAGGLTTSRGIVVPSYQRQRGHPVGFDAAYRESLLSLTGDAGARAIVQDAGDRLAVVETEDAGVIRDIDVPADLDAGNLA